MCKQIYYLCSITYRYDNKSYLFASPPCYFIFYKHLYFFRVYYHAPVQRLKVSSSATLASEFYACRVVILKFFV